ncbi:UNVERIFIED_CONTAM: hypothetical protein Sradi_3965700 [Sesamum radiatum]|uniref:Uncharacterized protein n=1 Tax=Sesamum radiatum TaxID=300843 RepID=A0AAW2PJA8_SESRA
MQENFIAKLRGCRVKLLEWNKEVFGNVRHQCRTLSEQICQLKQREYTTTNSMLLVDLRARLEYLTNQEELLWKQRAKALWLKEGDKNTAFFHAKASERKLKKEVKCLKDDNGIVVSDPNGIKNLIQCYFADLFKSTRPSESLIRAVVGSMDARVTDAMNEDLARPFVEEEISLALKQMHPL